MRSFSLTELQRRRFYPLNIISEWFSPLSQRIQSASSMIGVAGQHLDF